MDAYKQLVYKIEVLLNIKHLTGDAAIHSAHRDNEMSGKLKENLL